MSSDSQSKYITVDGVLKLNPNYKKGGGQASQSSTVMNKQALAFVSNPDEVIEMSIRVPKPVSNVIAFVQDPEYVNSFGAKGEQVDGGEILDRIGSLFSQYEIPLGLAGHLIGLKDFVLHFKIDDSGSMSSASNLLNSDLSSYSRLGNTGFSPGYASRWVEVKDRLHLLTELLAYVPVKLMKFSFLNNNFVYTTSHFGKTPDQFASELHQQINYMFTTFGPRGSTPLLKNIQNMLREATSPTMHYILTDGVPDGGAASIRQIENVLLTGRGNQPQLNPITFLSCSNNARDIEWMHESEEIAPYVASLHDFRDEQLEVYNDQGPMFPYSRGLWLLANLAAARDPNGLDAMDMHVPLSKGVLDALLGRVHSAQEYRTYFTSHPTFVGGLVTRTGYMRHLARVFEPDYHLFVDVLNVDLIPSVRAFKSVLSQRLKQDIDREDDNSEDREVRAAEDYINSIRNTFAAENIKLMKMVNFEKQTTAVPMKTDTATSVAAAVVSNEECDKIPVANAVPYSSSDYYSYPTLDKINASYSGGGGGVGGGSINASLMTNNDQFSNYKKYTNTICYEFVAEKHARSFLTSIFLDIFGNPWKQRLFRVFTNRIVYFEESNVQGNKRLTMKGEFSLENVENPPRSYSVKDGLYLFELISNDGTSLLLRFASEESREAAYNGINNRFSTARSRGTPR